MRPNPNNLTTRKASKARTGNRKPREGWVRYPVGTKVAGAKILGVAVYSPYKTLLTYEVKHLCCKRIGRMTHGRIIKRINAEQTLCKVCGKLEKTSRDYPPLKIPLPLWPKSAVRRLSAARRRQVLALLRSEDKLSQQLRDELPWFSSEQINATLSRLKRKGEIQYDGLKWGVER